MGAWLLKWSCFSYSTIFGGWLWLSRMICKVPRHSRMIWTLGSNFSALKVWSWQWSIFYQENLNGDSNMYNMCLWSIFTIDLCLSFFFMKFQVWKIILEHSRFFWCLGVSAISAQGARSYKRRLIWKTLLMQHEHYYVKEQTTGHRWRWWAMQGIAQKTSFGQWCQRHERAIVQDNWFVFCSITPRQRDHA